MTVTVTVSHWNSKPFQVLILSFLFFFFLSLIITAEPFYLFIYLIFSPYGIVVGLAESPISRLNLIRFICMLIYYVHIKFILLIRKRKRKSFPLCSFSPLEMLVCLFYVDLEFQRVSDALFEKKTNVGFLVPGSSLHVRQN